MKRFLAPLAVSVIALTACGGDGDVSPDQLNKALVAQGLDQDVADCVTDRLAEQLNEDDFTTVALADESFSGVSPELQDVVTETVTNCVLGE